VKFEEMSKLEQKKFVNTYLRATIAYYKKNDNKCGYLDKWESDLLAERENLDKGIIAE